jgi:hypothetical protein
MIIVKLRSQTSQWYVYHKAIGADKYLQLNLDSGSVTDTAIWQNTAPTSTVFSIGSGINANLVAYCFAPVAGYSAFGSYSGNGSTDGPFVYTGFRPAWVLFKLASSAGGNWFLFDVKRSTYNVVNNILFPNAASAEYTAGSGYVDFTSNGFKIRTTSGDMNGTYTYIYAAFAENPFKYSLAR